MKYIDIDPALSAERQKFNETQMWRGLRMGKSMSARFRWLIGQKK